MYKRQLESELGVPLFDRSGRSIVLNAYGEVFLSRVNRILLDIDNAKKEINEMKGEQEHTLFAVSYTHLDVYKRQAVGLFLDKRDQELFAYSVSALRMYCLLYTSSLETGWVLTRRQSRPSSIAAERG